MHACAVGKPQWGMKRGLLSQVGKESWQDCFTRNILYFSDNRSAHSLWKVMVAWVKSQLPETSINQAVWGHGEGTSCASWVPFSARGTALPSPLFSLLGTALRAWRGCRKLPAACPWIRVFSGLLCDWRALCSHTCPGSWPRYQQPVWPREKHNVAPCNGLGGWQMASTLSGDRRHWFFLGKADLQL